ncbi:globin-3-like [Paramacrobiotus metropolitanus]|uniref:globin-3-like n=1 Tax=Paramacrobiotus metropolitanus TaxID=2943436 RepID=UPI002445EE7E|nr:globin-3-like [Paramacrobiotus metropolitanus]
MGSKPSKSASKSKDKKDSKSGGGANSQLPAPAAVPALDPRFPLSARDKFSLVKSWKNVNRNLDTTGKEMMIKLIADNDDLKQYFPKFKDKTGDQLRSSEDFETLAVQHMTPYDQAILDVDNVDALISNLQAVGKGHKQLANFQEEYFTRIEKCLLFALQQTLGDAFTDNMDRIYKQWLSWTTTQIQGGFRS